MSSEFQKFYAKIWSQGNTSMVVTIPSNLVKFADYKKGDKVVVMIQKSKEEKEDEQ